jgi:hypothetical protein
LAIPDDGRELPPPADPGDPGILPRIDSSRSMCRRGMDEQPLFW